MYPNKVILKLVIRISQIIINMTGFRLVFFFILCFISPFCLFKQKVPDMGRSSAYLINENNNMIGISIKNCHAITHTSYRIVEYYVILFS